MNENNTDYTPFFDYNYENLPEIWGKICIKLHTLYPYLSKEIILQSTIVKTAQMISGKRITFDESGKKRYANWFTAIFLESGGGKDRLVDDIDEYLLGKYKVEQNEKNNNLPLELEDATQAGIYNLAENLSECETGSIFIKLREFLAFIKYGNKNNIKFVSDLCKLYDCKIPRTLTKSGGFTPEIANIPINAIVYSDYTALDTNTRDVVNALFLSGLCRRFMISFQPQQKWTCATLSDEEETAVRDELRAYGDELFNLYNSIPLNANYKLLPEAKTMLNEYKTKITDLYNKTENTLLKREIRDRIFKAVKLSCFIACLNHPSETIIYVSDLYQAIETINFLSTGLEKFIKYNPECNDQDFKAFKFLENNLDKGFSKTALITELCKCCGYTRRGLNNYFDKAVNNFVSSMQELAEYHGYRFIIDKEKFTNGTYYYLQKNCNTSNLPKTIITKEQPNESEQF